MSERVIHDSSIAIELDGTELNTFKPGQVVIIEAYVQCVETGDKVIAVQEVCSEDGDVDDHKIIFRRTQLELQACSIEPLEGGG